MPAHRFEEPEGMTAEDVGTLLGLTRQRVNKIELGAIRKLWRRNITAAERQQGDDE